MLYWGAGRVGKGLLAAGHEPAVLHWRPFDSGECYTFHESVPMVHSRILIAGHFTNLLQLVALLL
jgi:hypothetical protein